MTSDVRISADVNELSRRAAEAAVTVINGAVRSHGRCSLVLSGGSTPRTLYGLLASVYRDHIPWTSVHIFFGDERYVPPDDPDSNYRMAKETLLDHVPCPAANIHPMPTHFPSPDDAARDYEKTLRSYFGNEGPHFDLILLGLGEEGHTASLFPGSPALKEQARWVVAVTAPAKPPVRLTLTLPALTRAANIYVLVAGSKKAGALQHVLTGIPDPNAYPAAGIRSTEGTLIWWVDRDAAAQHASSTPMAIATGVDPAGHKGTIQGDRPDEEQDGNASVPALDGNGLPVNPIAIAEDRIGANVDDSEVANADETGRTTDAPRDELRPLK
jgi:6-phosphogluconolactonase